jgi:hypothetical protein
MKKDKIIVVLIGFFFFLYIIINLYSSSEERQKYKYETICYINNGKVGRSFNHINGYYFFREKRYETYEIVDDNPNKYIGKYYKIVLSSKNPNNCEILYNEEVTDLKKIKKAGF